MTQLPSATPQPNTPALIVEWVALDDVEARVIHRHVVEDHGLRALDPAVLDDALRRPMAAGPSGVGATAMFSRK